MARETTELTILLALQTYSSLDLVSKPAIEIPPVTVLATHRKDYGEGNRGGSYTEVLNKEERRMKKEERKIYS